jgi:hypothetical protein
VYGVLTVGILRHHGRHALHGSGDAIALARWG